jgi:protein tyrosine kinase modulator
VGGLLLWEALLISAAEATRMDTMEQAPTFRDYVDIVKRRRWYFIVPAIIVLLGSVVAAVAIPPLYRSTGKILVESQQIPSDLVQPTVTSVASQRIAFIQERIMTRSRLTEIIKKFSLYPEKTH